LERLKAVQGLYARLIVNTSDGIEVSTAKAGGYLCATVPAAIDDAIASAAKTTTRLTHSTVKSKMALRDSKDFTGSEILLEYHLQGRKPGDRVDALNAVRSFQWMKTYQEFEPENPSMVAFMRPLYDGAFVPNDCKNNDERMVEERVEKLKADKPVPGKSKKDKDNKDKDKKPSKTDKEPELTPFLLKTIEEFGDKFNIAIGANFLKLVPYDYDVVYDRQGRPSQRRILEESEHGMRSDSASVFQKREAYGRANDPRAITQINGVDKREYSAFIYALADRMKALKWYAFGKTPRKIASRVAKLCKKSVSHVDSTDFSRMDGRVKQIARFLERNLMLKVFNQEFHLELLRLMKTQTNLKAKTKNGVRYNTGFARASGSPETSAFNTILNAFIAFLTARMTRVNGRFKECDEAWEALGLYGGDDGLTPDEDGEAAEKAARMMGQVMTVDRTKRGDMGVAFLARHYGPDVWWGDTNSCCDIRRQLAKFHVTTKLCSKVTPIIKLREKAFAFSLSDSHTPVIGQFVTRVLEHIPMRASEYTNVLEIWNSGFDKSSHYPNESADWMVDLLEHQIPTYDFCGFLDWVVCASIDELLLAPVFCVSPDPVPQAGIVSVDDDITTTEPTTTPESSEGSAAPANDNTEKKRHRGRKPKARPSQRAKGPKRGSTVNNGRRG